MLLANVSKLVVDMVALLTLLWFIKSLSGFSLPYKALQSPPKFFVELLKVNERKRTFLPHIRINVKTTGTVLCSDKKEKLNRKEA